ncbi:MAG: ParB/RepB/Spo0J family partition protein, partial [Planctomycetes bacterium]|nr:ParB/RepB/Spo0J family partition protein [Planctomycetota bacterium]
MASLLSEAPTRAGEEIQYLDAAAIVPSPLQPRKVFDPAALERLVESINENGLLQPVVVRRVGEKYELIVGERRWRAAQQLGLDKLPAIVR